ncbi:MAG TPA: hypothetical protein VJT74_06955, partial [Pyrinomonadaceae bacterium]|nr:hypothetical protein [Pyrinomonadaceae bacterium]
QPAPAHHSGQPASFGRASVPASSDDALLDLGDLDAPPALVEADDFILDLQDEAAGQQPSFETPVFETDYAPPAPPEPVHEEYADAPACSSASSVEEAVRAPEHQPAAEAAPREQSYVDEQTAPTERLPEGFQFSGAAPATEDESKAPSAAATAGQITLEQLSPEAIEAIARRAAELLSERVVEQIAWEVVPDLAERLIKRKLEEERS